MVVKLVEDSIPTILNIKKLDKSFEETLNILRSKNARLIYKILYDQKEKELTTLDMQKILEEHNIKLSKKELHNWLKGLMDSGLISKSDKRGKPTTLSYNKKYTFDLWHITKKGTQIAKKIMIFLESHPNQIEKKIIYKQIPEQKNLTANDFKNLSNIFYTTKILIALHKSNERIDTISLSKLTKINYFILIQKVEDHVKEKSENMFQIREKSPNLVEKILNNLFLKPRKIYWVSITKQGENFVKDFLKS
jgi:DNA-binding HxlR family transcriptional regulator